MGQAERLGPIEVEGIVTMTNSVPELENNVIRRTRVNGLCYGLGLAVLGILSPFTSVFGQLTELGATTASGATTSAQFRAGATADGGLSHKSIIGFDEVVDVLAEVSVEEAHINTMGNAYVVALETTGNTFFMALESGEFVLWDQNPATLQPFRSAITFSDVLNLPIVGNIAFGPLGVSDTAVQFFVAYDTTAVAGELYYSPAPLTLTIEAEQTQATSLTLYQQSISGPIIQGICRSCHVQGGQASPFTDLLYVSGTTAGIVSNYNTLVNYIRSGKSSTLLAKPTGGTQHDGGVWFTQGSNNFTNWSAFINQVLSEN